jgi:hypothetical protein
MDGDRRWQRSASDRDAGVDADPWRRCFRFCNADIPAPSSARLDRDWPTPTCEYLGVIHSPEIFACCAIWKVIAGPREFTSQASKRPANPSLMPMFKRLETCPLGVHEPKPIKRHTRPLEVGTSRRLRLRRILLFIDLKHQSFYECTNPFLRKSYRTFRKWAPSKKKLKRGVPEESTFDLHLAEQSLS